MTFLHLEAPLLAKRQSEDPAKDCRSNWCDCMAHILNEDLSGFDARQRTKQEAQAMHRQVDIPDVGTEPLVSQLFELRC